MLGLVFREREPREVGLGRGESGHCIGRGVTRCDGKVLLGLVIGNRRERV